jgi:hypothetical protein
MKGSPNLRVAVIILALVAMILGPVSGSASAHVPHAAPAAAAVASAEPDCDRAHRADEARPDEAGRTCAEHSGACMDVTSCRHLGCLSGGPVPVAVQVQTGAICAATPIRGRDRLDGRNVAPLLDPPRSRA